MLARLPRDVVANIAAFCAWPCFLSCVPGLWRQYKDDVQFWSEAVARVMRPCDWNPALHATIWLLKQRMPSLRCFERVYDGKVHAVAARNERLAYVTDSYLVCDDRRVMCAEFTRHTFIDLLFSPDGNLLALNCDCQCAIFDTASLALLWTHRSTGVAAFTYNNTAVIGRECRQQCFWTREHLWATGIAHCIITAHPTRPLYMAWHDFDMRGGELPVLLNEDYRPIRVFEGAYFNSKMCMTDRHLCILGFREACTMVLDSEEHEHFILPGKHILEASVAGDRICVVQANLLLIFDTLTHQSAHWPLPTCRSGHICVQCRDGADEVVIYDGTALWRKKML